MRAECKELKKSLSKLQRFTTTKSNISCLSSIMFDNGYLVASSLDVSIRMKLDCDFQEGEKFLIPKTASDLIAKLPGEAVVYISKDDGGIVVNAGAVKSRFSTEDDKNFPEVPAVNTSKPTVEIDMSVFCRGYDATRYAVSTNQARPIHTGILIEGDGGMLNFVGVDGFRASWYQTPSESDVKFVIPAATAQKIVSLGLSGTIGISIQNDKATFEMDGCTVYGLLLTGNFIKYRDIYPKHTASIQVKRKTIESILDRCMVGFDKNIKKPVVIGVEGHTVSFDYTCLGTKYHEETTLDEAAPMELKIGFNPVYLQEALKTFTEDVVTIYYNTGTAPVCIQEEKLQALVLPVRLSSD